MAGSTIPWPFGEAERKLAKLRDLCRTEDDGGGAAYVRLSGDDPMDYDERAQPMLAVAVADVLRVLDEVPDVQLVLGDSRQAGRGRGRAPLGRTTMWATVDRLVSPGRDLRRDAMLRHATIHRSEPVDRPLVPHAIDGGMSLIALFLHAALVRREGAASAAELRTAIADRVVGPPLTSAEVRAALAELRAAGRVSLFAGARPRYLASVLQPHPALEPALAVLIAEHLADLAPAGADVRDLVDHLTETYRFPWGREPRRGSVIVAAAALAQANLAVQPEPHGAYHAATAHRADEGRAR